MRGETSSGNHGGPADLQAEDKNADLTSPSCRSLLPGTMARCSSPSHPWPNTKITPEVTQLFLEVA